MKRHKCNCSDLLQKFFSLPHKQPSISRLSGTYVICDPTLMEIDGDVEITIIGHDATWKIQAEAQK